MSIERAYFTVSTRDTEEQVLAYLYSHTSIIFRVPQDDTGLRHFLLEIQDSTDSELRERARAEVLRLAQYQANRLASGLHGVSRVYEVQADAVQQHFERCGVFLAPLEDDTRTTPQAGTEPHTDSEHTNDYSRNLKRRDERRTRLAVAAKGDVLSQGRFLPGDRSAYPAVPVIRVDGSKTADGCYLTHLAIVRDNGVVQFEHGHYDLTWEEAVADLASR